MRLHQVVQRSLQAMENDRKALSGEIHDGISGSLTAIKILMEGRLRNSQLPRSEIRFFEKIVIHLADAIKETKRISRQIRPPSLNEAGISAAVTEPIENFKQFYPNPVVDYRIACSPDDFSGDAKMMIYRVVQEALNNIGQHSGASRVNISLVETDGAILLKIKDDGCGFDFKQTSGTDQRLHGYGMLSMKDRVELYNGEFHVQSEPGAGTLISAVIPKTALLSRGNSKDVCRPVREDAGLIAARP